MKSLALGLIRLYQRTLSPDHGWLKARHPHGFCRFQPTCSQYTYQAVERFGVFKGTYLGLRRILRCHPWSQGGPDPVPDRKTVDGRQNTDGSFPSSVLRRLSSGAKR